MGLAGMQWWQALHSHMQSQQLEVQSHQALAEVGRAEHAAVRQRVAWSHPQGSVPELSRVSNHLRKAVLRQDPGTLHRLQSRSGCEKREFHSTGVQICSYKVLVEERGPCTGATSAGHSRPCQDR